MPPITRKENAVCFAKKECDAGTFMGSKQSKMRQNAKKKKSVFFAVE